jgi:hypothetical protein
MNEHKEMVGFDLIAALAGPRQAEEDFNKRHTMSHPPEHIPDMEHIDDKPKPVKDLKKKEEKLKEKVNTFTFHAIGRGYVMCCVLFPGAGSSYIVCGYK